MKDGVFSAALEEHRTAGVSEVSVAGNPHFKGTLDNMTHLAMALQIGVRLRQTQRDCRGVEASDIQSHGASRCQR